MRSGPRLVLLALAGCGARAGGPAPLVPPGDLRDDGTGVIARASASFLTADDDDDVATDPPVVVRTDDRDLEGPFGGGMFGGTAYGGAAYGGDLYGGLGYGGVQASWGGATTPAMTYETEEGLSGAVEGVVTWSGAVPARGACGSTLHVGADRGVGGALVYIAKVDVGRMVPMYARPATIGGVVVKRGCALLPAAQIVSPLPATLTIHGDATASKLRVTAPTGATRGIDLQEGGQAQLDALSGVMRIESDDGAVTPAWVIGVDTPYYAITDDAGRFRIDELAAGTYDVAVWQAPLPTARAGVYGAPIVAHRTVAVGRAQPARLNVALP